MPSRRTLAALLLAPVATWPAASRGAEPPAAPIWESLASQALAPIRAALAASAGPLLLRSWPIAGTGDFGRTQGHAAYTYDNALAGLALLAAGDRAGAGRIAEGLRLAQTQDRFWRDGRLRNATAAGPQVPDAPASAHPPGWWDAAAGRWLEDGYQAGSAAGPVAFAILLWRALAADGPFRAAAEAAADWLETLRTPAGYRGGTIGHEPAPTPLLWRSTEQNADLAAAFARLGRTAASAHAADFVRGMWSPAERRFFAGRLPEGGINGASALDANIFPLLALPDAARFAPALDWVLARHGLPAGAPAAQTDGLDFNDDRDGIWLEGSAQAALALRLDRRPAERLAATLAAQRGPGGWIRAASIPWLTTGLGTGLSPGTADFRYPARGHLAANAWAALAALGANPFNLGG